MNIEKRIKTILMEEINESNFLYKAKDLIGRLLLKDKYNTKPSLSFDREFGTKISQKYNYPFGLSENKIWRVLNNCSDGSEKNCILVKKIVDNLGDYFPYPDYNNLPFEKKVDILQGMVSNFNYDDIISFSVEKKTGENNELEDEVNELQNKLNYRIQWVPSKQTIGKIKKHINLQESTIRILIKETEKLNPFVLRRIDLDKFESLLNKGSVYMFYESNSLEEFKWKLVTANLENYIYFKYDIEIDLSDSEYDNVIEYLVNLYSIKLESMYNNLKKERGLTESILNEVTNPMLLIFRRVPQERLDKEFESSLNYISRLFIKNYKSNPRKLSEQEFTRMVAIDLIQMLDFRNIFPNDVEWYEDVIKTLINHYDDRTSTMYNVLKK